VSRSPTLRVSEIFVSIQGESTHAGRPCAFVRLAGCTLRCSYCDTPEARDDPGEELEVEEIVERVEALEIDLVEVTGGEPLHQAAAPSLLSALCDAGHEVLLETSGAFPIDGLDSRVGVVLDIKTPGSGMDDRMHRANLDVLRPERDQVKFVVTSRDDFEWAVALAQKRGLLGRLPILISPASGRVAPDRVAEWVLTARAPLRLQLQLHKIIWGEEEAGR
jgi:7-carboxy-7-deazaguanine synthase